MLTHRRLSASLGMLAALVGLSLFAGCGSDSSMPTGAESMIGSGSSHESSAASDDVSAGKTGKTTTLKTLPPPILVSRVINGATGGEVVNGRYKVWFAPGAFTGSQTITISDPQKDDGEVVLGPEGLTFSAPVILTIDIKNTKYESPFVTIEWWNPSTAVWVDMLGLYNADQGTVSTMLRHFSIYRPRAGW